MGQKIRQAMADRDAAYQLAGLLEMDDAYLGATKRGRGASGKAKVLVAVETPGDQPRFAALRQVPQAGPTTSQAGRKSVCWRQRRCAPMAGRPTGCWQRCCIAMNRDDRLG